jgi:hypothetical protein
MYHDVFGGLARHDGWRSPTSTVIAYIAFTVFNAAHLSLSARHSQQLDFYAEPSCEWLQRLRIWVQKLVSVPETLANDQQDQGSKGTQLAICAEAIEGRLVNRSLKIAQGPMSEEIKARVGGRITNQVGCQFLRLFSTGTGT